MPSAGRIDTNILRQSLRGLSRSGSLAPIERHLDTEGLGHLLGKKTLSRAQADKVYKSVLGSDVTKRLGLRSGQLIERNLRTQKTQPADIPGPKMKATQKIAQIQKRPLSWREQLMGHAPSTDGAAELRTSQKKVTEARIAQGKKDTPAEKPTVVRPVAMPTGGNISVASARLQTRRQPMPGFEADPSTRPLPTPPKELPGTPTKPTENSSPKAAEDLPI